MFTLIGASSKSAIGTNWPEISRKPPKAWNTPIIVHMYPVSFRAVMKAPAVSGSSGVSMKWNRWFRV